MGAGRRGARTEVGVRDSARVKVAQRPRHRQRNLPSFLFFCFVGCLLVGGLFFSLFSFPSTFFLLFACSSFAPLFSLATAGKKRAAQSDGERRAARLHDRPCAERSAGGVAAGQHRRKVRPVGQRAALRRLHQQHRLRAVLRFSFIIVYYLLVRCSWAETLDLFSLPLPPFFPGVQN